MKLDENVEVIFKESTVTGQFCIKGRIDQVSDAINMMERNF